MVSTAQRVFPNDERNCPETLVPLRVADLLASERTPSLPPPAAGAGPLARMPAPGPEMVTRLVAQERRIAALERRLARSRVALALIGLAFTCVCAIGAVTAGAVALWLV